MTKTLKKILLLVTCVIAFFCIATFSACDLGARCSHEYGEWKIEKEATCTEKGSKTHTCSKCNNVETEEIAAAGHNGAFYCSVCNKAFPDEKFSTALKNSFGTIKKNSGIEIAVNDFEFTNEGYSSSEKYSIKNLKGFIGLNDSGELFAYGNLSMTLNETSKDDNTKPFTADATSQFVVKGNLLYYYASSNVYNYEMFDIIDIAETIGSKVDSDYIGGDSEAFIETLSNIISNLPIFSENSDLTNKTTEALKTQIDGITANMLSNVFGLTEEDGKYILTKKDSLFSTLINDVERLTAMKFIEKYFGKSVSEFISDTSNFISKKISELEKELAENNIAIDDIVAVLDGYVKMFSGDQTATFESLTNIDIKKLVEQYKDKTLVDIVYEVVKDKGIDIEKNLIENQILGTVASLSLKTIPKLITNEEVDFTGTKKLLALIDEISSFKYVFANDGETCGKFFIEVKPYKYFEGQSVKFNESDVLTGYISFGEEPDASGANVDVDGLINKVNDKIEKSEEYKKLLLSVSSFDGVAVKYEYIRDGGSQIYTYIKNADGSIVYINSSSEEYYEKIDEYSYNVYVKRSDGTWMKDTYTWDGVSDYFDYEYTYYFDDIYDVINYEYGLFTYDETEGVYYCHNGSTSFVVEDGKLVKMERYGYGSTYTFFYDDINLTLPTIENGEEDNKEDNKEDTSTNMKVGQKFSSEEEWNAAMSFDGIAVAYNGVSNYGYSFVCKKNAEGTILYICEVEEYDDYDVYYENYYSNENGNYYHYMKMDDFHISGGGWEKNKSSEDVFDKRYSAFDLDLFKYSDYNYNEETGVYEGVVDSLNWKITFANNRVVKIDCMYEYNGTTKTEIVDFLYDDIEISLPKPQ